MLSDNSLKIVHCLRKPVGGVLRHVGDLVRAQAAAGHRVGLICGSSDNDEFSEEAIASLKPYLGLGILRLPIKRTAAIGEIASICRMLYWLHRRSPNVVHGHGAKGGVYARLVGTALGLFGDRAARVYSPHGGSLHFSNKRLAGRIFFAAEWLLERLTDGLIFVSKSEQAAYEDKVGVLHTRASVIYNGVSAAEFGPILPAHDAADFVSIGEMRRLKGTDVLIRAFASLVSDGFDIHLALVGPGTERPAMEALASKLGVAKRIRFHGSMPMREALTLGRIAVVPSRAESLPYIVLESVAAEVPVIATRVGGIPEIFGDDAWRLIRPDDPSALAAGMSAALSDPAGTARRASILRDRIRPTFCSAMMAATVEATYRSYMINAQPSPRHKLSARPVSQQWRR